MYLYIPKGGRSIVVGEHTISSTGMAFTQRVAELDAVIGILLDLEAEVVAVAEAVPAAVAEVAAAVEEAVVQ